ncbi:MAG: hypothetical protein AAFQ02_09380, partial [Bacteroidota bacterium]
GLYPYAPALDINISPVGYISNYDPQTQAGYLKLSKGTTNTWNGQGGYTLNAPNYYRLHTQVLVDQWQDPERINQNLSKLDAKTAFDYYLSESVRATLGLSYEDDRWGRYGKETVNDTIADTKARYQNTTAKFSIQSFNSAVGSWNYGLDVNYNRWNSIQAEPNENNITLDAHVDVKLSAHTRLRLQPNYQVSNSDWAGNTSVLGSTIALSWRTNQNWNQLGTVIHQVDNTWQLWPRLHWDFSLAKETEVSLHANQVVEPLSAARITDTNPFTIGSSLRSPVPFDPVYKPTSILQSASISVSHQITPLLRVNPAIGYSNWINDLNFTLIPEDSKAFGIEYVNYNAVQASLAVESSSSDNLLAFEGKATYAHFMSESDLWNRAPLHISTTARYQPFKRMSIGITGLGNSPTSLGMNGEETIKSNWRANISADLNFQVFKHLSLSLHADNVLDNRFEVWRGYPTFGRNLSIGLLGSF